MSSNFTLFHILISHFLPSTALSSISPPHPFIFFSSLLPIFLISFLYLSYPSPSSPSLFHLVFMFFLSPLIPQRVLSIYSLALHYSRFLVTWLALSEASVGDSQYSQGHRLLQFSVTSPIFDDEQL